MIAPQRVKGSRSICLVSTVIKTQVEAANDSQSHAATNTAATAGRSHRHVTLKLSGYAFYAPTAGGIVCTLTVPMTVPCQIIIKKIIIITSASVELTQTCHSHSKQLFHGGQISQCFYREGQKATYAACKPLFLAVAEI